MLKQRVLPVAVIVVTACNNVPTHCWWPRTTGRRPHRAAPRPAALPFMMQMAISRSAIPFESDIASFFFLRRFPYSAVSRLGLCSYCTLGWRGGDERCAHGCSCGCMQATRPLVGCPLLEDHHVVRYVDLTLTLFLSLALSLSL